MTEFNYEQFTDDFNFAVEKVKEIIELNSKMLKEKIREEKDDDKFDIQDSLEKSCVCLVNLYLTSSKIFENLSKTSNTIQLPKNNGEQNKVPQRNKLDDIFSKKT